MCGDVRESLAEGGNPFGQRLTFCSQCRDLRELRLTSFRNRIVEQRQLFFKLTGNLVL